MSFPDPGQSDQLLMYSLISFREIIEPVLSLARPRAICEIGVEKGLFTQFLIDYCAASRCSYTGIDPSIEDDIVEKFKGKGAVFLKDISVRALKGLQCQDVYFIDGDHNYYTVRSELLLILPKRERAPLIFLHDVCWPWGRRDQYCSPETIPASFRHPNSSELGVVPAQPSLQEGVGFCGSQSDYSYAAALNEGGPRNGVLTAVEDVIEEMGGESRLIIVPAVFGLGILYFPNECSPELLQHLKRLSEGLLSFGNLLNNLETNRISLFFAFLKQDKQFQNLYNTYSSLKSSYQDLDAHSNMLASKYQELTDAYDDLHRSYKELQSYTDKLIAKMDNCSK